MTYYGHYYYHDYYYYWKDALRLMCQSYLYDWPKSAPAPTSLPEHQMLFFLSLFLLLNTENEKGDI